MRSKVFDCDFDFKLELMYFWTCIGKKYVDFVFCARNKYILCREKNFSW